MDHKNTNRAIMAFVILSVIVHGIIAYVILETNHNGQNLEPIEIVDQEDFNETEDQKVKYKKPRQQKNRIARKKPRVKTPRVETPRVETPHVEKPRVETPGVEAPRVETSGEDEVLFEEETGGEAKEDVLSELPEAPLDAEPSSGESSVSVSDESSKVVDGIVKPKASEAGTSGVVVEGSVSEDEETGASSDGSESVAIQELKKVAGEPSAGEPQDGEGALSSSEGGDTVGRQGSSGAESIQKPQASSQSQKKQITYRVDQVHVIRPTSFKYPQDSRRLKEEGTAILRMFFDKSGNPQKIKVIKSTGSLRLDDAARQGASTLRLKSLGYAFIYELPVRFQLDFTDQQLNQSIDLLAPETRDRLGKFKSKAQSSDE